ncbi:hypothetical protein [Bradyrhizobium hereditatis]|nr:hypothetical protein [Bradyrhizobium hereditatis]
MNDAPRGQITDGQPFVPAPCPSLFPPYDTTKWNVLDLTRRRDER